MTCVEDIMVFERPYCIVSTEAIGLCVADWMGFFNMCEGCDGVCAAILHSELRSNWVRCC